jgi:hypothetical protein
MNLCDTCQHCRKLHNDRGSIFLLCERSFDDPTFPKYPRLPVLDCRGYEVREVGQVVPPAYS